MDYILHPYYHSHNVLHNCSTQKREDEELTRKVLEDMRTEQTINQRNIDIIQQNENISKEEAEQMLRDLGLD